MFKTTEKKQIAKELQEVVLKYNQGLAEVNAIAFEVYNLKIEIASNLIPKTENYLNRISNYPRIFLEILEGYKNNKQILLKYEQELSVEEEKLKDFKIKHGIAAGSGLMGGIGIATLGPAAATAIASTYGVASTGVAISTLSGAAAQSAALAWLGGGAIAAGGGGVAAGTSLLALLGPIGIAVGGVTLAGTGIFSYYQTKKQLKKAKERIRELHMLRSKFPSIISNLRDDSKILNHTGNIATHHLNYLSKFSPLDYHRFNKREKEEMEAYITTLKILTSNLKEGILG